MTFRKIAAFSQTRALNEGPGFLFGIPAYAHP